VILDGGWGLTGYREALDHLEHLGHTRIAVIAPSPAEKEEIEERVMRGLDIPEDLIFEGPADLENGYGVGRKILGMNVRPTAIIAGSDETACGVMHALREGPLEAPKDYSIIGCGDTEWSEATVPPLTTIHVPYREMAQAALDVLSSLAAGEERQMPNLESKLVVRGSTGRPSRALVSLKRFDRDRLRGL
jgi:DNA-binding LacI/PurR family transcriptional regulator